MDDSEYDPRITWWCHYMETLPALPWLAFCVWSPPPTKDHPDSKIHGANVGPTWGRQDPGEPHAGHRNLAIWVNRSFDVLFAVILNNLLRNMWIDGELRRINAHVTSL